MPNSAVRQFVASFPAEAAEKGRVAPWAFASMLLGFAAALIATAAEYPNFFAVNLDHLEAEAP